MSYFQLCLLSWWYYFQRLGHECTPTPQRTPFFSPLFPAFIPSFIPVSAHNKSLPNSSDKSLFHHFLCPVHVCVLSCFNCIILCATLWTVALQAPLSMGFSRQEYWSGLPCPPPGDLPHQGLNLCLLCLLHWQMGSLTLMPLGKPLFPLPVFIFPHGT